MKQELINKLVDLFDDLSFCKSIYYMLDTDEQRDDLIVFLNSNPSITMKDLQKHVFEMTL